MNLGTVANGIFQKALHELLAQKLPVKTSWKIRNIVKTLEDHLKIYNDSRDDLLQRMSAKNEDGSVKTTKDGLSAVISEENKALFIDSIKELNSVEVIIEKIKLSELGDIQIDPYSLIVLGDLVEE